MQTYANRFSEVLSRGLHPVYLIFGDEPQQKLEAIELLRTEAKRQGFDERQSLLADSQFNWQQLVEATQSLSLFSSKIFIELELPDAKPGAEGAKILHQLSTQTNADTIILLHGPKVGKDIQKNKWFKSLESVGIFVPCYPLEGNQLNQWISKQLQQAGLTASAPNCKILSDYCEGNLLAAKQEIEKLALLFPDGQLNPEQIEQSVVDQSRFNVFQLIDVLLAGDAQKSVKMLYRFESEGIEPNIILWALVREWQTLRNLKHSQQQNQTINWNKHRIWANRQALYLSALERLNDNQLEQIQHKLAIMDSAFKQSQVSRPYIELCHLCLLFIPMPLSDFALA